MYHRFIVSTFSLTYKTATMKATIKRGFAITGLFIAISCTKENVAVATHKTNQQNLAQTVMLNDNLTGNAVLVTIGTQVWMQRNLNVGFTGMVTKYRRLKILRHGPNLPQVHGVGMKTIPLPVRSMGKFTIGTLYMTQGAWHPKVFISPAMRNGLS